jgi:hypothetical protein
MRLMPSHSHWLHALYLEVCYQAKRSRPKSISSAICAFLACSIMLFVAGTEQAKAGIDTGAIFKSLTGDGQASIEAPSHAKSQSRSIYNLGGYSIRGPSTKQVQFISISPPSIKAGCNGISAHFGGFSFISGSEISRLIDAIAKAAPGMILNLVIKQLYPFARTSSS